ncbi:exopolyphosphatase PRUNE1-like [Stylophora pistillata]|nr:exopolyphosphatase PRUNE1-like [Stylophora pistillata]
MVSSLLHAFSIYKTLLSVPGKPAAIIPVFNIPKEDFCLRTEAVFLFRRYLLDSSFFIFVDDVDLENLLETGKLQLILVDHNILAKAQKHLDVAVFEILDHHKDQWPANLKVRKNIEPVGSCCTLVAEKLLALDLIDGQMSGLLLGTILLDTVNLDPRAGRATDRDRDIVKQLQEKFPLAINELYRSVSTAKFDVSALSTLDLLRKDYKALPTVENKDLCVGISSVSGLSLSDFFSRTLVHHSISEYCQASSLDVLIIMFLYFVENLDDPPSRQIAVCGPHEAAKSKIAEHLSTSGELKLKLNDERFQNCFVYDQDNIVASRKVVFPLVLDIIKNRF